VLSRLVFILRKDFLRIVFCQLSWFTAQKRDLPSLLLLCFLFKFVNRKTEKNGKTSIEDKICKEQIKYAGENMAEEYTRHDLLT
jgi:hypothetical protein